MGDVSDVRARRAAVPTVRFGKCYINYVFPNNLLEATYKLENIGIQSSRSISRS